jgi:hypothetical protein
MDLLIQASWQTLFITAWIVIPVLLGVYLLVVVPNRLSEVRRALSSKSDGQGKDRTGEVEGAKSANEKKSEKPQHSPAWHYAMMQAAQIPQGTQGAGQEGEENLAAQRKEDASGLEKVVTDQFFLHLGRFRFVLPGLLLLVLSGITLLLVKDWLEPRFIKDTVIASPDRSFAGRLRSMLSTEIVFAMLGAYVWTLYELSRRIASRDLIAEDLFDISFRFLWAVPVGYVSGLVFIDRIDPVVAFVIAGFPLRDVRRMLRAKTFREESAQDTSEASPGSLAQSVNGLGPDTLARLEEIGITTFLDLAYQDPVRIMVHTGAPLRQVLTWMDQAILYVYADEMKHSFAENGLPCALDVYEFYETHFSKDKNAGGADWKPCQSVQDLAQRMGTSASYLREVSWRVHEDPQTKLLYAAWWTSPNGSSELRCPSHA